MKKIVFAILAIVVIAALILVLPVSKENTRETESYLRIHIRANSNSDADQELKYKVKQAVVDFMTPLLVKGTRGSNRQKQFRRNRAYRRRGNKSQRL